MVPSKTSERANKKQALDWAYSLGFRSPGAAEGVKVWAYALGFWHGMCEQLSFLYSTKMNEKAVTLLPGKCSENLLKRGAGLCKDLRKSGKTRNHPSLSNLDL